MAVCNDLREIFDKKSLQFCYLWTTLFFLIGNVFAMLNFSPQHDELNHPLAGDPKEHCFRMGRFLLPYISKVKGDITIPWMTGVLTIIIIGLMVYVIADLLKMKNQSGLIILSASLTCNACITALYGAYEYNLDSYCFSALIGIFGVYLLRKRKNILYDIGAIVLFVGSLGIYQAEIAVAMIVLLLSVVNDILDGKDIPWKDILRWVVVFLIAGIVYYAIYKGILYFENLSVTKAYNDLSSLNSLSLSTMFQSAVSLLSNYIQLFFGNDCFIGEGMRWADIILGILGLCGLVIGLLGKKIKNCLFAVLCIACIPVLSVSMGILMGDDTIRCYCSYGLFLFYPALLIMIRAGYMKMKGIMVKVIQTVCVFLISIVFARNAVYANGAYSVQKIVFEKTQSVIDLINHDLLNLDGYTPGETEVIIVGPLPHNSTISTIDLEKYADIPGFLQLSTTYMKTFRYYTDIYTVPILSYLSSSETNETAALDEVQKMQVFPNKGYMKMIDGKAVVKVSGKVQE